MSLERLLNLLGTSVPDLDADALADALYLAVYLREPPSATDSQSSDLPEPTVSAPAQQILAPQPEEATSSSKNLSLSQSDTSPHQEPISTPAAGLYTGPQMIDAQDGLVFRAPQAPPLPEWNELARALRPLHIRVPSRHSQALDIRATVRQIAESRIWLPVLRPLAESCFEIALVMDDTPAMAIWQSMVYELAQLLQRHSALRKLRSYRLSFDNTGKALLAPGLVRIVGETPRAAAGQLSDPSGRTLILIASDAVGQHWRDGRISQVIAAWAKHSLVSLVQVLPATYWDRSALGSWPAARADAGSPGAPNRRLPYVARRGRLGRPTPSGVPLPVLNLDPVTLSKWAKLAAGVPAASTPAYLLPPVPANSPIDQVSANALDPDTIVNTFLGSASPVAQHLAGLLAAAAPLSLPVARLVQGALLSESRQIHLAEVWLSGLLRPTNAPETSETDPDELIYEFQPGVRERLYSLAPATESLAVLRAVSGYIGARMGQPKDFRAWVQSDNTLDANDPRRPFAAVAASVLYGMGGDYRVLAERLARAGGLDLNITERLVPTAKNAEASQKPEVPNRGEKEFFARRYRIEARIGSGRFAEIFRAYDTFERRAVVLKQLRETLVDNVTQRIRFERETHILSSLAYPGVVQLLDYGEIEGRFFLVMELLQANPPKRELADEQKLLAALMPVAEAIDAMHRAGYLHNDINPTNLFWHDQGRFVLGSFGSATVLDDATPPSTFGASGHLAPEVKAGQLPTPATDRYSFGFTVASLLVSLTDRQISPDVDSILQAIISVEPARRPRKAVEIITKLSAALFRSDFSIFLSGFATLRTRLSDVIALKEVHDLLHTLQFQCYAPLTHEANRFPDDELAHDYIANYALTLRMHTAEIQEVFARAPEALGDDAWVEDLRDADVTLHQALETRDPALLRKAIRQINQVLAMQPSYINAHLIARTRGLHLRDLAEKLLYLQAQIQLTRIEPDRMSRFNASISRFVDLCHRIEELVSAHDAWQAVDREVRRVSESLRHNTSELEFSWPDLRERLADLVAGDADWAQALRGKMAQLDTALAGATEMRLEAIFQHCSSIISAQFFRVDVDLKHACLQLREPGDPLAELEMIIL